jgi:magnesium transporter
VHEGASLAEAIEHIRKSTTGDDAFSLYVVDDHDHLVGFVPLHRLLAANPATPIRTITDEDVESVTVDTDQEEVGGHRGHPAARRRGRRRDRPRRCFPGVSSGGS